MNVDTSSAVAAVESGANDPAYSVSMLRKARSAQQLEGAAAVRLIDSSTPQMIKTADGHISVRA
jgi:hypothetical protein